MSGWRKAHHRRHGDCKLSKYPRARGRERKFDESLTFSAATKKLSKLVHDFTESMYKETGARLVVLGSFVGTLGQKQIAWYANEHSRPSTLPYSLKLRFQ